MGAGGLSLEAFDAANNSLAVDTVTNPSVGAGEADTLSVSGGGTPIARLEIRRLGGRQPRHGAGASSVGSDTGGAFEPDPRGPPRPEAARPGR